MLVGNDRKKLDIIVL